jgi:spermidine synthase
VRFGWAWCWLLLALVGGAVTMVVELSAVRLLAPYFGTALSVWTHVIGVLLLGLALGYALGARLSLGPAPARRLGLQLLLAGALTAALPWLVQRLSSLLLPEALSLADAARLLERGSLATSLCCFLPPAVLLGSLGPLVVESLARRTGAHAGQAGGLVFAASTLGSLLGTFATHYWLLPNLGVTNTHVGAAGVLLLLAIGALWSSGLKTPGALLLIPLGLLWAVPEPPRRALRAGLELIDERESPYAQVRVLAEAESGLRYLAVNEHSDSFQSVWAPEPGLLPPGFYYNYFVLPAWWRASADPAPRDYRVLLLGLGAGSAWRVLQGALPPGWRPSGVGVELDPVVVELAREHLDLPAPGGALEVVAGLDARAAAEALRRRGARFDLIVLDCYANQMEVPEHLGTVEHFQLLGELLEAEGHLAVNVGAFDLEDPVLGILGASAAAGLEARTLAVAVKNSRNAILFGSRRREPVVPRSPAFLNAPAELLPEIASRGLAGLAWFEPRVLASDDRSGLASAQQRALRRAADGRRSVPPEQDPLAKAGGEDLALERGRSLLAAGELEAAREQFEAAPAGIPRELELARLWHRAGRYDLALEASIRGLPPAPRGTPEQLELAWWGANAALWIARTSDARSALERLRRELETAHARGEPNLGAWQESFDGYARRCAELDRQEALCAQALSRGRSWSLWAAGIGALLAAALLPVRVR